MTGFMLYKYTDGTPFEQTSYPTSAFGIESGRMFNYYNVPEDGFWNVLRCNTIQVTHKHTHTLSLSLSHNVHTALLIGNNHTKINAHLRPLIIYNLKIFYEKILIEFIITHCRDNTRGTAGGSTSPSFRNADRSSAESRAVVPKFNATDDGRVSRNSDEF
jgi:hypothetical protein